MLGVVYGATRYETLKKREDAFRAKEEAERPAREAALLAEKKKKNEGKSNHSFDSLPISQTVMDLH